MGTPPKYLSHQEGRVLRRIKQGMTTPQIAADMGLKPETVRTYRKRILDKAGATTMAQAVTVIADWPEREE